jgi:CHAT domain
MHGADQSESNRSNNTIEQCNYEKEIFGVLEWLWDEIADPILCRLGYNERPSDGATWPKVWWCPTGLLSFLPIHAAGYHNDATAPHRTVLDRVVSAYTSTIRALKYSRAKPPPSGPQTVLIAAMPTPRAQAEAAEIAEITRRHTVEWIDETTIQEVYDQLRISTIAHFACHAQIQEDPSLSGLIVEDGRITVGQISQMKLQHGVLAYLSACTTALSHTIALEDEALTITSAFQVAGFARVVGTLWEAADHVALDVAIAFYKGMEDEYRDATEALHSAVSEQRRKYHSNPSMWASYIYTGA